MKSNFNLRIRIIFFVVLVFALILLVKIFSLQVLNNEFYSERADRQYATPAGDLFERGTIFFKQKDSQLVSAATQTTGFKIAINPTKIEAEKTFEILKKVLPNLDEIDFFNKANKTEDPYEEIAEHLSKEEADNISVLKLPGVSVFKEKWRFYPAENLAAHALGLVAYKGDELAGRYGLEKQYENVLARSKDSHYINFFAEVFSNLSEVFSGAKGEGEIITTIEPVVQSSLEKTLKEVRSKYQVDSVGGIIMNPKDGSIYALASQPNFNPNDFSSVKDPAIFSNPLVENVLEFGSVVKPLVMAAALDKEVLTANTKYEDKGSVWVEDKEIFNFDKKGRGVVNMQEVLTQSLNTGMVFVSQKLGKNNMYDYLLAYGLKEKTGIDLPNETNNLISNLETKRNVEYANASFGQGIALTPISMIRALTSLSNGGNLVVPHLVEKIKYNNGTEEVLTYQTKRTMISEKTSQEITRMLVNVMDKGIKGGTAKLEHHSVAVKTGTAQVANNISGGYYEDRHTHSFFGYFPAYDPKFIILLYAINPKGVPYASYTWSDPFINLTKFLLNYYEIPPDR